MIETNFDQIKCNQFYKEWKNEVFDKFEPLDTDFKIFYSKYGALLSYFNKHYGNSLDLNIQAFQDLASDIQTLKINVEKMRARQDVEGLKLKREELD